MPFPSCRQPFAARRGVRPSPPAFLAALFISAAAPAMAQTNLVTNGTFATPGVTTSFQFGTYGPYTPPQLLSGWASAGYNYVFLPTSTVATGEYGNLSLWSPANGSANGFTNAGPGPAYGNFVGADGAYGQAPITQTINGLKVGHTYTLSFAWAGAQQSGYTAVNGTTEYWAVSLGATTQDTPTISVANEGFSGWLNQTFNFVATSSSEALSFFATGTPSGVPPFALLANVSLVDTPEPAGVALMLTGIAGLIAFARHRRGPGRAPGRVAEGGMVHDVP